jgi:hypothetical protein
VILRAARQVNSLDTGFGETIYSLRFSIPSIGSIGVKARASELVSVMAVLGNDDRLVRAHEQAVDEALEELESCAATRVRVDSANEDRLTGNLALGG